MTAKPLYDIMRALVAETVLRPGHPLFANHEQIKSLLGYIEVGYNNLTKRRGELLHGTWFIGYPTQDDPDAVEFIVDKYNTSGDGLKRADELPKNADELLKIAEQCSVTQNWIGHVGLCVTGKHPLSDFFKVEGKKEQKVWYLRYFPDREDAWTTLQRK